MSELSFLLDLLLEHKLPKATKDAIKTRIKEIESPRKGISLEPEQRLVQIGHPRATVTEPEIMTLTNPDGSKSEIDLSKQSPSMRAKLLAQEQTQAPGPAQPAVIAQTPAAAAALASRNQAIAIATSGVEEKGRTSPRKF